VSALLTLVALLGGIGATPAAAQSQTLPAGESAPPPAATTSEQCLTNLAAPPQPPDLGDLSVVLAAPQLSAPTLFAAQLIPADGSAHLPCPGRDGLQVMQHPTTILVAHGAALAFIDDDHKLLSAWGTVNVPTTDPAPVLYPGRPDFSTTYVYADHAPAFLHRLGSCRDCVLAGQTLNFGTFPDPGYVAYHSDLSGANLYESTWQAEDDNTGLPTGQPVQMVGWNLSNADLSGAPGPRGANLTRANLTNAVLDGTDLTGANLTGAVLRTDLRHVNGLNTATLDGADLTGADLDGVDLSHANLTGAVLRTDLEHVVGLNTATLDGADLTGASLAGLDLSGVQLNEATVDGTVFDGADLRGARLLALKFTDPPSFFPVTVGQFNGACSALENVDLRHVNLTLTPVTSGCETSPLFPGSTLPVGWIDYLREASALSLVSLGKATFFVGTSDQSILAGKDLSGINLTDAAFVGWPPDLSKTTLNGATLEGTSLPLADLSGATLHNVQASGASFRGARLPGAHFDGSDTSLHQANFNDADVTNASFSSADLSGATFDRVLAVNTNFNGVRAADAEFNGAHIYGDGRSFDTATDLKHVKFINALLAGAFDTGGFDLHGADLSGAIFDGSQCIGCNFTGSNLYEATFIGAYLPGAILSSATMDKTNLDNAWLYCGALDDSACQSGPDTGSRLWPLELAFGETYGPIEFMATDLTGVTLLDVSRCPDGNAPNSSTGCQGDSILPNGSLPKLPIACSADGGRGAAGLGTCLTRTTTLFDASSLVGAGKPLTVTAASPPVWATTLSARGSYVGLDDGTVRIVGDGAPRVLAGQAGRHCAVPTDQCGDGGPASEAQLGLPAGLAVGLDGSTYVADSGLHRVRRIDPPAPDGTTTNARISTVAGTGQECNDPTLACGDGFAATSAALAGPSAIWVDPSGYLWIADGRRGLRVVGPDGVIRSVASTSGNTTVGGIVGDEAGDLYAATTDPDYLLKIDPALAPCAGLALQAGNLVQLVGMPQQTQILDKSCARRIVPNASTLLAIEQTYHSAVKPPLAPSVFERLAPAEAIPDSTSDPNGFRQAMRDIFGTVGATVSTVVGTGTSGYNGTIDDLCNLLPGTQVQLNHPTGLSVRADGDVLFADTGNNIVRAYNPAYGHVVDLGGQIDTNPDDCPVQGTPPGGFNQDGQWADQTELNAPQSVTATGESESLFVVADTRNGRVRLLGPAPLATFGGLRDQDSNLEPTG
jgi:uncharacterized protein YjbI with pentapeptide repeats